MSYIYNQAFKVPVWVLVNTEKKIGTELANAIVAEGGCNKPWPGRTVLDTIKDMDTHGWRHITAADKPIFATVDFITTFVQKHIKHVLGVNKNLTGRPVRPYSQYIDRKIQTEADYERIFNEVIALEDDIALSCLFSIAELCHYPSEKIRVFVTSGKGVPKDVLQRLAGRVIVVGGKDSDVPIAKDAELEALTAEVFAKVDNALKG